MCDKKETIKRNFELTKIDIHITKLEKGNSQAIVDISINDLIIINNIHVFEKDGEKYINMPYNYDGLFYTFYVCILDDDIYKLVSNEIIKKFDEQCAKLNMVKEEKNEKKIK